MTCESARCGTFNTPLTASLPWVVPPPRMPVTTRIITFLVGDPYKPSFATVTGRGDNPKFTPENNVMFVAPLKRETASEPTIDFEG